MALLIESLASQIEDLGYEIGPHFVGVSYMQPSSLHAGGMVPILLRAVQIFSDDGDRVPAGFTAFATVEKRDNEPDADEILSIHTINNRYLVEIATYHPLDDEGSNDE